MLETEEDLKVRLRRERQEINENVKREAAEAKLRLRNEAEDRHVTFSDEPPPVTTDSGQLAFEVDRVLDVRQRKRGREFLVRWVGYGCAATVCAVPRG